MQNTRPDNHIAISYVSSLNYVLTKTLFKHQHEEIEMKLYGLIDLRIQIIALLRLNRSSAPTLRINSPVYITKAINDDVLSFF
jgi:hypothetical protein